MDSHHHLEPAQAPSSDALQLVADVPLTPDEADYVARARSANTLRGYRSDWAEFTAWCTGHGYDPVPAPPAGVSQYLTELARHGAKVGTMSRRISAIRFARTLRQLPDPCDHARVQAVWEGIRRTHTTPADQSAPLRPTQLFDVIDACPTTKTWKTPSRPSEPDLAGLRDRALLLVGFVAALRRSELAALTVEDIADHPTDCSSPSHGPRPTSSATRPSSSCSPEDPATRTAPPPPRWTPGSTPPASPPAPSSGPCPKATGL